MEERTGIQRILLVLVGSASLVLGMIGLVVPLLPTTPFLLLSAACFLRSSKRLYGWLVGHGTFGPQIRSYLEHRTVMKKSKVIALVFLWASLLASFLLMKLWTVRLLLVVIGLAVSLHIASLKTEKGE